MNAVIAWIMAFIVAVAPPGRMLYFPDAQETKEEATVRYNEIAQDVVEVVYDPNTKPLFRGSTGRARTVSVILSIMLHESGFRRDVDLNLGKYARGDKGNSWCLMQLNVGTGRTLKWNKKHNRKVRWNDPPEEIHRCGVSHGDFRVQRCHATRVENLHVPPGSSQPVAPQVSHG